MQETYLGDVIFYRAISRGPFMSIQATYPIYIRPYHFCEFRVVADFFDL